MRRSLIARQQLRDAINAEIAERTRIHQAKVAALIFNRARLMAEAAATAAAPPPEPLVLLAHGDSWFDYPLDGNGPPFDNTDVIAQLETMGSVHPIILNISHHGDATTDEMSLLKQQRLIESLSDPDNWPKGRPDAILFSGGGNDIAGDQFCIYLDYANPGVPGPDDIRFQKLLGSVEASYLDLFEFRTRYAPNVRVIGHCYDFPIPDGRHPICAGPWLQPSLSFCGWNTAQGTAILYQALVEFRAMLVKLSGEPKNLFGFVETQGTLLPSDWANELHPYPPGFRKIAEKFVVELRNRFPGRI
jgi:hypothetical protein